MLRHYAERLRFERKERNMAARPTESRVKNSRTYGRTPAKATNRELAGLPAGLLRR